MIKSKQWRGLGLIIIKLGSVELTGHTDKASGIHSKPVPELGGYCTSSAFDHQWGHKSWVVWSAGCTYPESFDANSNNSSQG